MGLSVSQWVISLVALAASGAGGYWAYSRFFGEQVSAASGQLFPVRRGDISDTVSTNGSVQYATRETLTFGSPGTVGEVFVTDGQSVAFGERIASLDAGTTAVLERAVKEAELAVRSAEEKAKDLAAPAALTVAEANAAVAVARAAVRTAEDKVAEDSSGAAQARAQQDLQAALQALANAQTDLRLTEQARDEKVTAATKALQDAESKHKTTLSAWLGLTTTADQLTLDPAVVLASLGATYDSLFKAAAAEGATLKNDPATPWDESLIYAWVYLSPSRVIGACSTPVSSSVRCMQADLEGSWKAFTAARTAHETVTAQQAAAVSAANASVTKAADAITASRQALTNIESGAASQSRLAELAVAKAKLAAAEATFADVSKVDADALALAQAQLTEMKAKRDTARKLLAGATVTAPFAGVVSSLQVEPGQSVTGASPVIDLIDPTVLEVAATVDEIDVLSLRVGAEATISMDALSGQELSGTVSEIGGAATTQQGVVSYPVTVKINVPQGLELREGLSATAAIVVRSEQDALLVPVQAIGGSFSVPTVKVQREGKEQEVEVDLGLSDESWVAVRRGVEEGDQVVISASAQAAADLRLQRNTGLGQGGLFNTQQGRQQGQIFIAPAGGTGLEFTPGGRQAGQGQQRTGH